MERKTIFVIGAGASKEANLPTGDELKSKIAQLLDIRFDWNNQISGDSEIPNALRIVVRNENGQNGDINPYLHEAWHIRDAMPHTISIDNFIDQHRDNDKIALCGKLAIVKSILDAEKRSNLYFENVRIDATIDFENIEKTWYTDFFKLITENCAKNELNTRFQSITLIIFNYDRCIEHYLFHTLQNHYRVSEAEATELVKCIQIYHPYGCVGFLPWWQRDGSMAFGQNPNSQQLLELTQKIKTFTEGTDPKSSDIKEIKDHMAKASHLIFLGFAFHKLNMQLIAPAADVKGPNVIRCFATTYQISDSNKEAISEQISNLYSAEVGIRMSNEQCRGFFNEFWRSLAF